MQLVYQRIHKGELIWDYQLLIGGGVIASSLSETNKYPLQTDVATKEFQRIEGLRASTSSYGMTKLSTANDITDTNAYALSATEKNPSVSYSLGYKIAQLESYNSVYGIKTFYVNGTPSQSGTTADMYLGEGIYLLTASHPGGCAESFGAYIIHSNPTYLYNCHIVPIQKIAQDITISFVTDTLNRPTLHFENNGAPLINFALIKIHANYIV